MSANQLTHSIEGSAIIAQDFINFLSQKIAHCAFDQVWFFENAVRRGVIFNFLLHLGPLIQEEA